MPTFLRHFYTALTTVPNTTSDEITTKDSQRWALFTAVAASIGLLLAGIVLSDLIWVGLGSLCALMGLIIWRKQRIWYSYLNTLVIPLIIAYRWKEYTFASSLEFSAAIGWLLISNYIAAAWLSFKHNALITLIQISGIVILGELKTDPSIPFAELYINPILLYLLGAILITVPVFSYRRARMEYDSTYDRLRESEQDYRRLFEQLPIGIYRSSVDGKQLRANPTLVKLNGYDTEAEMLRSVNDIAKEWYIDPKRRSEFTAALEQDGKVSEFESEIFRHKTRERIWINESAYQVYDADGNTRFYEGTVKEITDRKIAQQEVVDIATQLRLITNNIPAWISQIDRNFNFVFVNQFFETRLGIKAEDLIGKPVSIWFSEREWRYLERRFSRAMKGETIEIEGISTTPTGEQIYTKNTLIPNIQDGEVVGCFSLGIDLTHQREMEMTLQQMRKVESLGMVAGGVAHDFNNLLTGIMAQSSVVAYKLGDSHSASKNISRVLETSRAAERLVKQLLAYTGDEYLQFAEVDLNALVEKTLTLIDHEQLQGSEITIQLTEPLRTIRADASKVEQILVNLIINGVQAIDHKSGEIHIVTRAEYIEGSDPEYTRLTGEPLESGNYCVVTVKDNGKGIAQDAILQIFDPFYTTKFSGHGLGLAAVLGNVRAHHGGISVKSTVGQGTCFKLAFPTY